MKLFILPSLSILTSAFSPQTFIQFRGLSNTFVLHAENAPQYEKIDATLSSVETLAKDAVMLHVQSKTCKIDYKPGHVIALEIEGESNQEKNKKDIIQNNGWMRGPYTISRATENSFDILLKVVGDKSKTFASAPPGTPLRFGGKFKVPIIEGVNKETTKKVVFLSTGVGVGPCIGAIELALKDECFPPIELYPSYRTSDEVICRDYLDMLANNNPDKFKWKPFVTTEIGRNSNTEENVKTVASSNISSSSLVDTHYHLIGNGQMVNEWKEGLMKAGVPEDKITLETYFNHRAEVEKNAIDNIANIVSASCCTVVTSD